VVRGVILGVVGLIVVLVAVALTNANTDGGTANLSPAIEALIPAPGTQQPQQSSVGVDLVPGWTAELEIAGRAIPLDQMDSFDPLLGRPDNPLGLVLFNPGPGKEFEVLPPDQVCVVAQLTQLDGDGRGVQRWCFDIV
jgi:hypothetical protein